MIHTKFLCVLFIFSLFGCTLCLNKLVIKGYKFFDEVTGANIPIKGIDYYPRPNTGELDENNLDFYTDEYSAIWQRDIPEIKATGANAIRLYAVDPSKNHDKFMCTLSAAGIYVIVGLAASCEGCAVTKGSSPECYPAALKTRGQLIIRNFAKYENVLGFSAGNEVNHVAPAKEPEHNGPCQKKFLRDMRKFIASCPEMRNVPVGVVVADSDRDLNALYYNCQSDPNDEYETAEWYGLNTYVHCDGNVKDIKDAAGFRALQKSFQAYKYSIPVLLTEFGCLNPSFPTVKGFEAQRTFEQAGWMLSPEFREDFAGGFVFEYSTENANAKVESPYPFKTFGPQNYGLGYFSPELCDDIDEKCEYIRMPNFGSLAKQYNKTTSGALSMSKFSPSTDRTGKTKCPEQFPALSKFEWAADKKSNRVCPSLNEFSCSGVNPEEETKDTDSAGDSEVSAGDSSLATHLSVSLNVWIITVLLTVGKAL